MANPTLWVFVVLIGFIACQSTVVQEFSCPLQSIKGECSTTGKRMVYHGIRHTFIKIGSKCYDYGSWNYARTQDCDTKFLECCVRDRRLEKTIRSHCTDRMMDINGLWMAQDRAYDTLTHNCQDYTHAVIKYLRNCDKLDWAL